LYYADRLMEFPAGLLGAALGTVLLPSLAKCHAAERHDEYSRLLDWGLRLTFLLAAPAALALAILAVPLITTLFHHGAFTATTCSEPRCAGRLQLGLLGHDPGEGAGTRLLRTPERPHAGQHRPADAWP
jgi:putative peptidoglycan lipid II flippase